jgi:uncharacterized protein (TIGR03086 family)
MSSPGDWRGPSVPVLRIRVNGDRLESTTEILDLAPTADRLSGVLNGITDDQLNAPTPCDGTSVAELLDHVSGLTRAFRAAAAKDFGPMTSTPPSQDASRLAPSWRADIAEQARTLAQAWTDPAAYHGMTQIGGVSLPGEVAGRIALNELLLHGWDLARATHQPYQPDPAAIQTCLASLSMMYPAEDLDRRKGIFGPPVEVPDDASAVDRAVAFSGRAPAWPKQS